MATILNILDIQSLTLKQLFQNMICNSQLRIHIRYGKLTNQEPASTEPLLTISPDYFNSPSPGKKLNLLVAIWKELFDRIQGGRERGDAGEGSMMAKRMGLSYRDWPFTVHKMERPCIMLIASQQCSPKKCLFYCCAYVRRPMRSPLYASQLNNIAVAN